jgi:hypothetical protein
MWSMPPRLHVKKNEQSLFLIMSGGSVQVCECNHLTDFTYMDETSSYTGLTLTDL